MAEARRSANDAIHQLDSEFMRAAKAKDAASLARAFYAEDAVFMPPNHPIVEGRSNIQAFIQGLIDSGLQSIELKTTHIEESGDLAYGRGAYTLLMRSPEGGDIEDVGKYIVCYRRQDDGTWKAVSDIFNSDNAAQ